jgi:hypothetical protein
MNCLKEEVNGLNDEIHCIKETIGGINGRIIAIAETSVNIEKKRNFEEKYLIYVKSGKDDICDIIFCTIGPVVLITPILIGLMIKA